MRKQFGYRAITASWLVSVAAASGLFAADLHFVFMADTLDPAIGTQVDLQKSGAWAQTIAGYTGLNLRFQSLSGELLTATRARHMLQAISPAADDVVYFAYSGHGANTGDSIWPTFALMTGSYLDFDEVVGILQPKPQRLLIVLADCCNAPLTSGRPSPGFDPAAQTALTAINFQNLFLNFRGAVRASSSSQGQYSLGDSVEGGLFLNTFIEVFNQMAGAVPSLTWQDVLTTTSVDVQQTAAQYSEPQTPQFVVNSEQVAAETPPPPTQPPTEPTTEPATDETLPIADQPTGDTPTSPDDPTPISSDATGAASSDDPVDSAALEEELNANAAPLCGAMAALPLAVVLCIWVMLGVSRKRRPRSSPLL